MHIETLRNDHDRRSFDCGVEDLNRYLKERALKDSAAKFSVTHVAVAEKGAAPVLGFCTVNVGLVSREDVSDEIVKKLPRYPMPVLHVGRLASHLDVRGQGYGKALLRHVANCAVTGADSMGIHALQLQSIDEQALGFYTKFGFVPLKDDPLKLYLPIQTLAAALAEARRREEQSAV